MLHSLEAPIRRFVGGRLRGLGRTMFDTERDALAFHVHDLSPTTNLTLYMHVPFCHAPLCDMCPFCRQVFKSDEAQRYTEDLRKELTRYQHLSLPSVYIGGGTPATLLAELMVLVQEFEMGGDELSIEAHPSDLTPKSLKLMKDSGVTRLSVGIQSFDEALLAQMGRSNGAHPVESLHRAQEHFMVNADLIYNFAGQTIEQFMHDLDMLIDLGVSQITCYPLMPAPGSFRQVDNSREKQYYRAMLTRLNAVGYSPLTPWAFARSLDETQGEYISNTGGEQYLGVGASAISKIGNVFTINAYNLDQYHQRVQQDQMPVIGMRPLSQTEDAQYFLLTSLFGLFLDLSNGTGNPYTDHLIKTEVQALRMLGLVTITDNIAKPTETGMFFLSEVMKDFYTGLNFFRAKLKVLHAAAPSQYTAE